MNKFLLLFFIAPLSVFAQPKFKKSPSQQWADSVYQALTFNEKVGQLFMVAAYSNKDQQHVRQLEQLVTDYHIGGVIFFQGGPYRQARITNNLQSKSKIPMFVGIDAEWGLGMRLDSTYVYPWNMTLGAIQDNSLIEKMGAQMAQQAKRLGIHFMFAPVVDVNTNAKNPVIGNRSFGEDKENVTQKSKALMKGMQKNGVYATAKHFPGHGDTSTDSHYTLPMVSFDKKRLHEIELYPYKKLISEGLASIMVAHLEVPALESKKSVPTSLSHSTITDLLKNELGFEGLIFTDALNMKGASNYKTPGEIDLAAFLAGNDVLLFSEDVPKAIQKFNEALKNNTLNEERLAYSVKKILKYKYEIGLNKFKEISLNNLSRDLNQPAFDDLSFELYKNIVTVIKSKDGFLPLQSNERFAYVKLGNAPSDDFLKSMQRYGNFKVFSENEVKDNLDKLQPFDKVIIGYHKEDGAWKNHNMSVTEAQIIDRISGLKPTLLISFAKPYALERLNGVYDINSIVIGYQNNKHAFEAVSNAVFGYTDANGKTPVSIGKYYEEGRGILLRRSANYQQSTAGLEQVMKTRLSEIDVIAERVVQQKIAPGAQILVLKDGKVVYDKVFGTYDYESKQVVNQNTMYDLASLSKILGTLPMIMKLYEEKQLGFEDRLGDLLPEFKGSDKASITIRELLTHQSGLTAWIPFYKTTLDENNQPDKTLYQKVRSKEFSIQVSENLYLKADYKNEIINQIKESKLGPRKYVYSDLNFILLQQIIESKYQQPLDELLQKYFLQPMGLNNLTYNPLTKMDVDNITPTEIDNYYRHTKIQGYVHDMGAAMLGGVAGHAGLFGNAYDVAKMMQFFLDGGVYNGKRLLSQATINAFNTCYYCTSGNRRGAGFDKPQLQKSGPTCGCTSKKSFGHTGFTGTMAWADPDHNLIYVFLSNRTYPTANENRLSRANIREDIQQIIYDSI